MCSETSIGFSKALAHLDIIVSDMIGKVSSDGRAKLLPLPQCIIR